MITLLKLWNFALNTVNHNNGEERNEKANKKRKPRGVGQRRKMVEPLRQFLSDPQVSFSFSPFPREWPEIVSLSLSLSRREGGKEKSFAFGIKPKWNEYWSRRMHYSRRKSQGRKFAEMKYSSGTARGSSFIVRESSSAAAPVPPLYLSRLISGFYLIGAISRPGIATV